MTSLFREKSDSLATTSNPKQDNVKAWQNVHSATCSMGFCDGGMQIMETEQRMTHKNRQGPGNKNRGMADKVDVQ